MSFKNTKLQLNNYKSDIFFETGTYKGGTSRIASELGFERVITVELQKYLYEEAKLLSNDYDIEFHLGDSPSIIINVLSDIDENKIITFWLDAHIDPGNYIQGETPDIRKCPLYDELECIKSLKRNDHIILVDDIRAFRKDNGWGHDLVLSELIDKIKEINPNYTISFIDGEVENDILVAKI
jgi:hypothetical protein